MEKICMRLLTVCSLILGSLFLPPAANAAVTSAHPAPHLAESAGQAQVFTYDTTTDAGKPVQASATLYEPTAPWRGKGERPTIVFGPSTRGQGDQCAPSRAGMQLGSVGLSKVGSPTINASYEYSFYMMALRHGARVIVADLIGLGMPGHHTYVNHIEEAHALLDAARSGLELAHAPKDAPIGFAGYSQGGGASLSAAEYAERYAPDLNVAGTYAGAPPTGWNTMSSSTMRRRRCRARRRASSSIRWLTESIQPKHRATGTASAQVSPRSAKIGRAHV